MIYQMNIQFVPKVSKYNNAYLPSEEHSDSFASIEKNCLLGFQCGKSTGSKFWNFMRARRPRQNETIVLWGDRRRHNNSAGFSEITSFRGNAVVIFTKFPIWNCSDPCDTAGCAPSRHLLSENALTSHWCRHDDVMFIITRSTWKSADAIWTAWKGVFLINLFAN